MAGHCAACRSGHWVHTQGDLNLCSMCYTSPFYTAKRKQMTTTPDPIATTGLRYDEGKTRVDLLPPDALLALGEVYGAGAIKYPARNWELGMPWSKVIGPLLRHLFKWMMGETWDTEDKNSPPVRHIAKVAWNAIALLTYELRKIGTDDRRTS